MRGESDDTSINSFSQEKAQQRVKDYFSQLALAAFPGAPQLKESLNSIINNMSELRKVSSAPNFSVYGYPGNTLPVSNNSSRLGSAISDYRRTPDVFVSASASRKASVELKKSTASISVSEQVESVGSSIQIPAASASLSSQVPQSSSETETSHEVAIEIPLESITSESVPSTLPDVASSYRKPDQSSIRTIKSHSSMLDCKPILEGSVGISSSKSETIMPESSIEYGQVGRHLWTMKKVSTTERSLSAAELGAILPQFSDVQYITVHSKENPNISIFGNSER